MSYHTRELPQVILKSKETYRFWLTIYRDFPKVERYGIGNRIEQAFLDVLEYTFCLSYLPPEHKIPILNKAITKLDIVKFFVQLAWESKIIPTDKYSDLIERLEEIGRQLGGWKKGLQAKTFFSPVACYSNKELPSGSFLLAHAKGRGPCRSLCRVPTNRSA